ncbi:MAG TPA: tripartite tricarboxylate transporter substrate binding protein [Eoetvoesiella sp.]
MINMRKLVAAISVMVGIAAVAPIAQAADAYPNQPIKLLVPFPPGGGTDTMARFVANALTEKFKWDVIVENRPGAGGTVGLGMLARATPNGYNLALGQTSNLSINPYLYNNISYDVAKDFSPVVSVASQPMVLVVLAEKPYKSVAELVKYAKANPGKLTVGNAGTGTVGDITGRFFANEAGIDVLHVPYKGAAPAMNDLLGGQTDAFFASTPAAMSQLKNPKINMLAITTLESIPQFPNVPPLANTLPGFDAASKTGILTPTGVPKEIIETLNTHINEVLKSQDLRTRIMEEGNVVLGGTVQEFSDVIANDSAKWSKIIKENNISIK